MSRPVPWIQLRGQLLTVPDPTPIYAVTMIDDRGRHPITTRGEAHGNDAIKDRMVYLTVADQIAARDEGV